MVVKVPPGSIPAFLFAAGSGVAVFLPDERFIGLGLVGLAVLGFLFQIQIDHQKLKARSPSMFSPLLILVGFLLVALGVWAVWHGVALHRTPESTLIATAPPAATKRSFDAETRAKFLRLVKERLPEGGTARVHYVALQFQPLGETIKALFDAAGWQADVRERQTSTVPMVKVQGVGVAAYNKHYMQTIAEIFAAVGVTDIYTDLRETGVVQANPKWPTTQSTVYVYLGYEEK